MTALRGGLLVLSLFVITLATGPFLHHPMPGNDPVRSGLLPPGTVVNWIMLDDLIFFAAPAIEARSESITIGRGTSAVDIDRRRIIESGSYRFWLGSDRFGRDLLGLLLEGGRTSILIAALSLMISLTLGISAGIAAATGGRITDSILMRFVDALLAFPVLFLLILVAAILNPGTGTLILILGFSSWMGLARLVRGQVMSLRSRPFVLAARTAGSPWYRIWALHYGLNIRGPVAQDAALRMGDLIIAEATLSFLGLGVAASIPTWGSLINNGHRVMLDAWWIAIFPGLAITTLVVSLALIGDGLRRRS